VVGVVDNVVDMRHVDIGDIVSRIQYLYSQKESTCHQLQRSIPEIQKKTMDFLNEF